MTAAPTTDAREGILGYGVYIPAHHLERAAIAEALGGRAGEGRRAVAGFDEDATSMAVEAARVALHGFARPVEAVWFSTVDPPYTDRTNATAVHAALDLPHAVPVADRNGSVRSGVLALVDALHVAGRQTVLTIASDLRTGLPGSDDESSGGDGAAAYLAGVGSANQAVLAELVATASVTEEVLDRWRVPGEAASRVWEERFVEFAYEPLIGAAFADALARAELKPGDVDHLVVSGTQPRAASAFVSGSGVPPSAVADTLVADVGFTGSAHFGLVLADVLDRAESGEIVVAVSVCDGADVAVLRTTAALPRYREQRRSVRASLATSRAVSYPAFLSWRGQLRREPPRRPDPPRPAAPPSLRSERWKFALVGSRCTAPLDDGTECGTRHLPPQAVCMRCHRSGAMVPQPFADTRGTVSTFTVDHLAYSPSPPLVGAVVDFDGGGRYRFELTDFDPGALAMGDRVEMTFRRLYTTADGVHNYFWKARPTST
jgi:hydroxymethylglutaryl-CoA synthase